MKKTLNKIAVGIIALVASTSLFAEGEFTYNKVTELRINADKKIYVWVKNGINAQEDSCTVADHYRLLPNNDAYDQIYKALLTAYISGATVSFKNNGGCDDDQPVINFMRLR